MKSRVLLLMVLMACPAARAADPPDDPRAELTAMRTELEQMRTELKRVRAELVETQKDLRGVRETMPPGAAADFSRWRDEREALRREQMAVRREQYRAAQDRELHARQSALEEDRREHARLLAEREADRPGQIPSRVLFNNPFGQENAVPYLRIQAAPFLYGNPYFNSYPAPLVYRPGWFQGNRGIQFRLTPVQGQD